MSSGAFKPSIQWLFAFVPLSVMLDRVEVEPPVLFFSAALAIVPIARLIVLSTEQIAHRVGDAAGGLLNATFGNAPELIISLVALRAGYVEMVRASLIGAILANLLLALGLSFLLGGLRFHEQRFNPQAARAYSTMMMLAAMGVIVPSGFSRALSSKDFIREETSLNVAVACVLLAVYALYLFFSLKTHPSVFKSVDPADESGESAHPAHGEGPPWSVPRAVGGLVGASLLAAWMSEILVGAAEGTGQALGMSAVFIGLVFLAIVGGAAESGSAIVMARKNRLDLSIGIALGSSIQIALFVTPMLVLASFFIAPEPMDLSFARAEVAALFLGVLIGTVVCGDGVANWYKGVQLVTVYAIIALMFYFIPGSVPLP
jgi:Ca2+:H+ antiporter